MDPEDESGSVGQGQNLHDLQNYLSTFNKEIEPGDDVLATMGVDSGVEDVSDLYSSTSGNPLQEPGEGGVASQFSSGFYSEQGILDTPLSDESAQQIQNLVSGADRDPDNDMTQTIKQEVGTIDLEAVQAQITNFGDAQLTQGIGDLQGTSMNQGLIMASLGDNLDPSAGKVIRIVSLGEEGQYFSLGDGSQMQILNQDLGITTDSLTTPDTSALALQSETGASANIGATIPSSILTTAGVSSVMVAAQGSTITTVASSSSSGITGTTQLVALQSSSDNSQPQLVALPQGTALTTEALQMSGLLSADGTLNSELGYQTITIVPSELSQGGDMNYVLIMAPQEGQKEGTQSLAQVVDLKQENQEVGEELVEINGEVKRVLRVIPKKYITSNFGAQLMCDYCDYTSPKRYLLTRHMKSHSDERPHKCKECDRGFKTPASLLNHINTHTGTRPHKCKTCDAAFTTSGELVRHIRYRHTFEKPHRCPNCDYASVELSKLKRHMRSHTGERPYKCPHCPYASPDTYKLKRHLRIHTGEKPYECDICHARFTQSNSLKAHKLIHSGNKPVFQCNLCPTTCGRKTDLKIHFNKLHSMGSPLECKKCSQVFSDRYSYKQHVRAHDIDKCFKCEECDFIANTERSFDLHAAIHSNGKKFECDTCHTSFNLQQSLDKHKLSCSLGGESGADSCSSPSRDKESTDEQSMDKSIVYRSTIGRPSHEGKSDTINSPEEGSSNSMSSQLMHGPLASDTLHKNLLQDIKAGKLGDVPQVVIVHPDGSLEEISSKLPMGDKLNLEDIFSALSNNEKVDNVENDSRESSQAKQTARGDKDNGDDIHRSTDSTKDRESRNIASDGEEDDNDNNGESSQCEASTQAELESDTDSVDDSHSVDSPAVKAARKETQSTQASTSASVDQSAISSLSAPATSVTEGALDPTTGGSTNALASLLQNVTTSATSASLCTSLSSLLPSSSSLLSTSTSDQAAASGNQQYVVVKGYTCLSGDTGQPTLVNVAVDKDALMKMFASLGNSGEGGLQLLTGDFDPSISVPMDTTQSGVFPVTQLPLHEFTNLSSISDAQVLNDSITTESNEGDSNTAQTTDSRKEMIPTNSEDILKNNLCETSHDDINISSSDNSVLKYSQSMTSDKLKDSGDKFLAGTSEPISISTQRRKDCISSTSSSSLPLSSPFVSLKMSLSNEQLSTEPLHQCQDTDSSVKLSLCDEAMETDPFPCEDNTIDETTADASIHLSDHLTSSQSRLGKLSSECADTDFSSDADQDIGGSSVLTIVQDAVSLGGAVDDDGADDAFGEGLHTPVKKDTMVASLDRQKRSSRKRSSTTDQALVMTGKRVRKALVKVSM